MAKPIKVICDWKKCTGCSACKSVCPTHCIKIEYNYDGFLHPLIGSSCIGCLKCVRVCPVNNSVLGKVPLEALTGHIKDVEIIKKSTSGGFATAISTEFVKRSGVVFGAILDRKSRIVYHDTAESVESVIKFAGSKYIQSDTGSTYVLVKDNIKRGNKVLYIGTPCQIAGLKNYLGGEIDNLFTVDFLCHGVASTKIFWKCLDSVMGEEFIAEVQFRNKDEGYRKTKVYTLKIRTCKQNTIEEELFGYAFANNLISRRSCGSCKYASLSRMADLTLADYGASDISEFESKYGVSTILVNSLKGKELLELIKDEFDYRDRDISEILPVSIHLREPAIPHRNRSKLFKNIDTLGYKIAINKYCTAYKMSFVDTFKHYYKKILKKIRKILVRQMV